MMENKIPGETIDRKLKRVLFCMETIASGGVEKRRLLFCKYLISNGWEIKIVCTKSIGFIDEQLKGLGIDIVEVGEFRHPFHLRKHKKVWEIIKTFHPKIIHGAVFEGMTMAAVNGYLAGVPIILLEETSDPQNRSKRANLFLKLLVKLSNYIIAISPEVNEYLEKITHIPSHKIKLIINGIDVSMEKDNHTLESLKSKYNIDQGDFVVGFVGRLYNDHKRVTDLIDSLKYIENSSVKLLIVGTGRDLNIIQEKVISLGLELKVIFAGYQQDTNPYYQLMDVLCVPSSREGFGLVAIEGMMHKVPVIASKVGGLKGIIDDGTDGFIIPPFTPKEIASKINILIGDPKLKRKIAENGFQKAINKYSAKRYLLDINEFYEKLLSEIK